MKKHLLLFGFILLISTYVSAKEIVVSSISELQTAANNAHPGDVILLVDGTFTTGTDITISSSGTEKEPITIAAKNPGKTEITGAGGFSLVAPASYIVIKGFRFTHASSKAKTGSGTKFCRWTDNIFENTGAGEDLTIAGTDHQVDHNTFQNKNSMGRFLAIRGTGSQIAERLWIHHNYFKNFPDQGGANGAEAFQFGLSGFSLSTSNSIVENNLFEDCAGENELISVKASGVTLRYNTIRNCPAQFTLRHGNKCQVYGNYFINTPGLRIFGDDHLVFSNYFESCNPAITVGNGDGEVADGAQLTSHDRPDRILIAFNTLVSNKTNIVQQGRKNGLGATNVTVACNIISGGGTAATISGPYTNPEWKGNIVFNTNGLGDFPATGLTNVDPQLARNAARVFHLKTGSPAINAAKGNFNSITVDIDGQPRKAPFDIGADEVIDAPVKATVLQPGDAGSSIDIALRK
jgi:poly(beta-D-mannuronate) lyase